MSSHSASEARPTYQIPLNDGISPASPLTVVMPHCIIGFTYTMTLKSPLGSVRQLSPEIFANEGPLQHRLVVARLLLIAGRNPPTLLQAADQALYNIPPFILLLIASRGTTRPAMHPFSGRNHRLDVSSPAPPSVVLRIVGPISSDRFRPLFGTPNGPWDLHCVHNVGEKGRSMALPRRKDRGHGQSIPVSDKMDFGGEPSASVPKSRAYSLVFSGGSIPFLSSAGPPAADRLARIVVLSTLNCSQSIWPSASSSP